MITTSMLSQQDVHAIRAFYTEFTKHLVEQDFDAFVAMYADDVIVMPPNHPAVSGREALAKWMRSFPKVTAAEFTADEIVGVDDVAYVVGRYQMTLEPEDAPHSLRDTGKFIEIRHKQPDGRWLIERDIFNSDLPTQG